MRSAYLEGADLRTAHLTNYVDMQEAIFDVRSQLAEAGLDSTVQVADVLWNGVSLIRVAWGEVPSLGDETVARHARWSNGKRKDKDERLGGFEAAARAYRQLAIALRGQGITEAADRFAYRAQIMQRKAFWLESNLPMTGFTEALAHLKTLTGTAFR